MAFSSAYNATQDRFRRSPPARNQRVAKVSDRCTTCDGELVVRWVVVGRRRYCSNSCKRAVEFEVRRLRRVGRR